MTVELHRSSDGALLVATTTDGAGHYAFNLPAGNYYLVELQPAGYSEGGNVRRHRRHEQRRRLELGDRRHRLEPRRRGHLLQLQRDPAGADAEPLALALALVRAHADAEPEPEPEPLALAEPLRDPGPDADPEPQPDAVVIPDARPREPLGLRLRRGGQHDPLPGLRAVAGVTVELRPLV